MAWGQYGNRVCIPRILKLLAKYGVPASFYVPAVVALIYPDEQRRLIAEGHEVAMHSWIHELNSVLSYDDERDIMLRSQDTLEKVTGVRPVGMRTASWDFSPHTLRIEKEMALLYDSSLMADEDCYELLMDGEPTGVIELPVEWVRDDAVYFMMHRFQGLATLHPADRCVRHLPARVRRGLRRRRRLPAHHASAHQRIPLAHLDPGRAHPSRPGKAGRVVRHPSRRRRMGEGEFGLKHRRKKKGDNAALSSHDQRRRSNQV